MKWYNVWFNEGYGWQIGKSYTEIKNLDSLEDARKCAKHIEFTTHAKEIRIKCITEEVVESYFVKSEEEALMDELVHLNELRECTKNLRDLYSSGPLKDSNKVSYADVSLANINNSIIDVEKKLKKFSDHQNETVA